MEGRFLYIKQECFGAWADGGAGRFCDGVVDDHEEEGLLGGGDAGPT